jgi:hypothetical protein
LAEDIGRFRGVGRSKGRRDGEKSKSNETSAALILVQKPSTLTLNPAHRPGTAHIKPLTLRTDHEHSITHHAQSVHGPSFTASIQSQHDKEYISQTERPIRNTALSHESEHSTNKPKQGSLIKNDEASIKLTPKKGMNGGKKGCELINQKGSDGQD